MYQNSIERMLNISNNIGEAVSSSIFPVETNDRILEIEQFHDTKKVSDLLDSSLNIAKQLDAKVKGKDLTLPVKATLVLKDKKTGKIIDRKKITLVDTPAMTSRGSFIYGGNDYHVVNQLRLKPGIYTRIKDNGEVESFFNLSKGGSSGFSMWMNPESGKIKFKIGGKNPELYALMKSLDVSDKELETTWGKELFDLNKMNDETRLDKEIEKIYSSLYRSKAESGLTMQQKKEEIKKYFENTGLSEDTTKITLGKAFTQVTPESLLRTSDKLIKVSKKEEEPDERDSLFFKNAYTAENLIQERIKGTAKEIQWKIKNNLNSKDNIKDIYSKGMLNKQIKSFITQSNLSTSSDQTNPLAMANALTRTTLMGEGGISSLDIITNSMRAVSPSHMGVLDPSQTPESKRIGINLNLASRAIIKDKELYSRVYDPRTNTEIEVTKMDTYDKRVAFPDQYDFNNKRYRFPKIRVIHKGKFTEVSPSEVDYILPKSSDLFSHSSNLIPFQANVQGNRTMMANKMSGQAISLVNREAPLVQVKAIKSDGSSTTQEQQSAKIFSIKSIVDGKVVSINDDFAVIKPADGGDEVKIHKYNNFPLSNKAHIHSEFLVKPGDTVKRGQTIAEDNFTKDGAVALGTNLNIAYLPFKDNTFEDGFVISNTAAKKLTSGHLYTYKAVVGDKDRLGLDSYKQQYPSNVNGEQQAKLDQDGVIKEGSTVHPGDILVALLAHRDPTETDMALGKLSKTLMSKYRDAAVMYDHDTVGKVVRVVRHGNEINVHVTTEKQATEGDKIVGRYGNKGIITKVLPDDEMPVNKDGVKAEVITSPYGVPSRINVGQIFETIAAKAALKKGSPIKITNMPDDFKSTEELKKLAKKYGVETEEELFDPKTGRLLAKTSFGPQHMFKLTHMVEKKMSSRNPYAAYNSDEQPAKGGDSSARSLDRLTWNALISHGARENLQEMATYKANKNPELWNRIRLGLPLPAPKTPFATSKLFDIMQAAGVNVRKDGQQMMLTPITDEETLAKSNGEIDDAQVMMAKTLRPIKDGLFDDGKTGGLNGSNWTHIKLKEPVVSPIMAPAAMSILGMTKKDFTNITNGDAHIDPTTREVLSEPANGSLTGGAAIKELLSQIDPKKELDRLKNEAKGMASDKLDKVNKQMRYLKALDMAGTTPDKAYVISNIPVLPPKIRPIYSLPDGSLSTTPINFLYRDLIMVNKELKNSDSLPDSMKKKLRQDLNRAVEAVQGLGNPIVKRGEKNIMGALETIKGEQPKTGYYQSVVFSKKQELTGQSTAAPSVDVSPDEAMIPKAMAWNLFEPFIHREMARMGYSNMEAKRLIQNRDPKAEPALQRAAENRMVWINRAPSLHKLNMLAMKPKIYDGDAIKVNPLIVGGYNLDFDGDTLGVYVPVSDKAVEESKRFMPSKVLEDPRDFSVTLKPGHDVQLGLFAVSSKGRKRTGESFNSLREAEVAFLRNKINLNDIVKINGYETTFGRAKLKEILPNDIRIPEDGITKKNLNAFFEDIASKHKPEINRILSDVARIAATYNVSSGMGLKLSDLETDDALMKPFKDKIKKEFYKLEGQKDRVSFLNNMLGDFSKMSTNWVKNNVWENNLATMSIAAGKPAVDQVKQLKFTPLVVTDEHGSLVDTPITRSYSEGVKASDFWLASHGSRKGMIDKQLQTAEPGYFAKQLISATANQVVSQHDCGTKNGITLSLDRDKMDILWRYDMSGALIDSSKYESLLRSGAKSVKVRSPITCEAEEGVCQMCYGTRANGQSVEIGANVGTEAGQVATERTTQLTMRTFHTGAVATSGPSLASGFERVQQLSHFPKFIQDRATLAQLDGTVTDIKPNPAGGMNIWVGDERHYCPVTEVKVKIGDRVKKGEALTEGTIKPQELLATKGIRATQDFLIDEMSNTFKDQGVDLNRRAFETVTRATTNVTKVIDPAGSSDYLPGDKVELTKVLAYNRMNPNKPIQHEPELLGIDFSSKISRDWMAKMNTNRIKTVLQDAVAASDISSIHSYNPVAPYIMGSDFGKGENGKY